MIMDDYESINRELKKLVPNVPLDDGAPDRSVYANMGELITCENGHPVARFMCTVYSGDPMDVDNQVGDWQQPRLEGLPGCSICSAPWVSGCHYHINGGWR
jgi:hypothetical protein